MRVNHTKTPYEVWYGRSPTIKYFRIFGSKYYIRSNEEDLGKFYARSNEGIFWDTLQEVRHTGDT